MSSRLLVYATLSAAGIFAGCSHEVATSVVEKDEPLFQAGLAEERRGELDQALNSYLKLLEQRRQAPETCLSAGLIYLNTKKDPVMATYYFRRVLELSPNHPRAEQVKGLILNAQHQFLLTIPGQFFDSNSAVTTREIKALREENERLKRELANVPRGQAAGGPAALVPAGPPGSSRTGSQAAPTPPPAAAATTPSSYVIVSGDTLSSISKKVYGNPNRWRDIYTANTDTLPNPTSLTVGRTLKIPR